MNAPDNTRSLCPEARRVARIGRALHRPVSSPGGRHRKDTIQSSDRRRSTQWVGPLHRATIHTSLCIHIADSTGSCSAESGRSFCLSHSVGHCVHFSCKMVLSLSCVCVYTSVHLMRCVCVCTQQSYSFVVICYHPYDARLEPTGDLNSDSHNTSTHLLNTHTHTHIRLLQFQSYMMVEEPFGYTHTRHGTTRVQDVSNQCQRIGCMNHDLNYTKWVILLSALTQ